MCGVDTDDDGSFLFTKTYIQSTRRRQPTGGEERVAAAAAAAGRDG
jgi:hypothetical protein